MQHKSLHEAKTQPPIELRQFHISTDKAMVYIADMLSRIHTDKLSKVRCCILYKDEENKSTNFLYCKMVTGKTPMIDYLLCQFNEDNKSHEVYVYSRNSRKFIVSTNLQHKAYCNHTYQEIISTMIKEGKLLVFFEFPWIPQPKPLSDFQQGFLYALTYATDTIKNEEVYLQDRIPLLLCLAQHQKFDMILTLIPKMVRFERTRDKLLMQQDETGRTVLHYAAYFNHQECSKLLELCPVANLVTDKEGFRPYNYIPARMKDSFSYLNPENLNIEKLREFALGAIKTGSLQKLQLVLPFISTENINSKDAEKNLLFQAVYHTIENNTERKKIITELLARDAIPELVLSYNKTEEITTLTIQFKRLVNSLTYENMILAIQLLDKVKTLNIYWSPAGNHATLQTTHHILAHPSVLKYIDLEAIIVKNNIEFNPDYEKYKPTDYYGNVPTLRQYAVWFFEKFKNENNIHTERLTQDESFKRIQEEKMVEKNIAYFNKVQHNNILATREELDNHFEILNSGWRETQTLEGIAFKKDKKDDSPKAKESFQRLRLLPPPLIKDMSLTEEITLKLKATTLSKSTVSERIEETSSLSNYLR